MKKTLFLLAMIVSSLGCFAQQGTKSIGTHLSIGGKNGHIGFGFKGDYFLNNNFRLEGVFDNYFEKKNVGMWDLGVNAHYVINVGDRYSVYPLLGFTMANWYVTSEHKDGQYIREKTEHFLRFGSNFGAGLEYALTNNVRAYFEAKDQIVSDYSQWVFNLGLKYRF